MTFKKVHDPRYAVSASGGWALMGAERLIHADIFEKAKLLRKKK